MIIFPKHIHFKIIKSHFDGLYIFTTALFYDVICCFSTRLTISMYYMSVVDWVVSVFMQFFGLVLLFSVIRTSSALHITYCSGQTWHNTLNIWPDLHPLWEEFKEVWQKMTHKSEERLLESKTDHTLLLNVRLVFVSAAFSILPRWDSKITHTTF